MKKEVSTKNKFYHFVPIHLNGTRLSDSEGIKLIRKEDCERFGGWDEDFAGAFGYEDFFFIRQARAHGLELERMDVVVINHGMGSPIEDCEITENKKPPKRLRRLRDSKDPTKTYNDNLRFKWERCTHSAH